MTTDNITIAPFLTAFFEAYRVGRPATELGRITYLDALLRRCLEAASDRIDCDECEAAIAIERVFNPVDPFASTMRLDKLLQVLGAFVHSPWLRSDAAMQAAQWRLVREIVDVLEVDPFVVSLGFEELIVWLRDHIDQGLRRTSQRRSPRDR